MPVNKQFERHWKLHGYWKLHFTIVTNFLSAIGSGTGILLAGMIIYQYVVLELRLREILLHLYG